MQENKNEPAEVSADRSVHAHRQGVMLMNLGTPDQPDTAAVRRYLAEFLSDPSLIRMPTGLKWMNKPLGYLIALFRAPSSARMYQTIWTDQGSPLKIITEDQVCALEKMLPGRRVFYAMRYGSPSIRDTLNEIVDSGIEDLIVMPMYPQFSDPTTGSALGVLYQELEQLGLPLAITIRTQWYDDAGYIHAQAELIHQYATEQELSPEDTHLLFSAHSLPVSFIRRGDPYQKHMVRTIELVKQRLGWPEDRLSLGYQSRLGPVEWLGPATDHVLTTLANEGSKNVLVCPISFTTDCLESLEEINVRYREQFEQLGGTMHVCPALNTFPPFMTALKDVVLNGPRSISNWSQKTTPLFEEPPAPADDPDIASLVMVGVSLPGRLGQGAGPKLHYTNSEGLRGVKRSQCEVPNLLRAIHDETDFREAWLWNTCHRFEFYGWFNGAHPTEELRLRALQASKKQLFGEAASKKLAVNVLRGADAYHQLLRTAAGLNSSLPGERDIREQLLAAHRLARCAGTAGPLAQKLLSDVLEIERELRSKTGWEKYDPDYCYAALSRKLNSIDLDLSDCRVVVIGGSTTSASVLHTFIEKFNIPSQKLTLLYRGHNKGGQIKLLRKAIGQGRRIRVQAYHEQIVTDSITQADLVVFGIDRVEPVIDAKQLAQCRDFSKRPLWVIDFNMFGSTSGLDAIDGVHLILADELEAEVSAYADELCNSEQFNQVVNEVDRFIYDHVRATVPQDTSIFSKDLKIVGEYKSIPSRAADHVGTGSLSS